MREIDAQTSSSPRNKSELCSLLIFVFLAGALAIGVGCTIMQTRPVQDMSDTAAALQAAKEVQSDSLAPELYRQAAEWFFKARQEYKLKNFKIAKDYAKRARKFAEQAEFEAIRNGGNRSSIESAPDPMSQPKDEGGPPTSEAVPQPQGTSVETYEEMQKQEEAKKKAPAAPAATPTPEWSSPGPGTLAQPTPFQ